MPVQIYTSSPIHASEADGPTPNTGEPEDPSTTLDARAAGQPSRAPATTSTTTSTSHPPSAQPGARPSLPAQTAAPQAARRTNYQPTQTQSDPATTSTTSTSTTSPPAPQPGAVPLPPLGGGQHHHSLPPPPPPPKTGTAPSSSSYSYAASSAYTPRARYHRAPHDDDGGGGEARNYSHPPGYQQNVHAAEFSSAQLAAHNQSVFHAGGYGDGDGDEDGVWSTAKRWAAAAGESIMAAEEQIWKKINGD